MTDIKTILYTSDDELSWNSFLERTKQNHFMFNRLYMEYHKQRIRDHSLIFKDTSKNIRGLLPCSLHGNDLVSHGALTFGGFLVAKRENFSAISDIVISFLDYVKNQSDSINRILYKKLPSPYSTIPGDEDIYALTSNGFHLKNREISSFINLKNPLSYSKGRKWSVKKSQLYQFVLKKNQGLDEFWRLLSDILNSRHDVFPTHSLEEIKYLQHLFPDNIVLYTVTLDGSLLAGTLMFLTDNVAHTQYIACSDAGKKYYALDYLIDHLIDDFSFTHNYFSFGVSSDDNLLGLNSGLLSQKEGFGARAFVHDTYVLEMT